MPFCPQCKYEYNPGVETCPECAVPLLERLVEEHVEPRPEAPLIKIAEGIRPMVEMLADILRKRGIHPLVKQRALLPDSVWPGPLSIVELWLRADDLEQHSNFIEAEAKAMGDHIIWFPGFRD